jgi:hypothetical protein
LDEILSGEKRMGKKIIIILTAILIVISFTVIVKVTQAKVDREYELAYFKVTMEWFGSVGVYDIEYKLEEVWNEYQDNGYDVIGDPTVIANMQRWQDEGIQGWKNVDNTIDLAALPEELDIIMDKIRYSKTASGKNEYSDQIISDCEKLIYGGFDFFGELDMLGFLDAIEAINTNTKAFTIGSSGWKRF